jgi:hypothetical protein
VFHRVTLAESFAFVASSNEWETFRSFGDVTGIDRWIDGLATFPGDTERGKLHEYERLRSAFVARVHEHLRSGEWIGEGFDPAQGPELRVIPRHLWRSLEFEPYDEEASGVGFRFVSLVMSSRADQEPRHLARAHTGKIPLSAILESVATPDEAAEYGALKPFAMPIMVIVLEAPPSEYERNHGRCCDLQERLWARVLARLLSGEWIAEGFTKGSLQRTRITSEIWPELRCDFSRGEAYSEPELELHFYRVVIDTSPVAQPRPTPGTSRRRLNEWLRKIATEERDPVRRMDLLDEAKIALGDNTVTLNMLDESLRANELGDVLIIRGRPTA